MGVNRVFDIARRSLTVYRQALEVTANNVANAANRDYTRQQVVLGSEKSDVSNGKMWGMGIKFSDIKRVRDNLTDVQIRNTNQNYYNNNKQAQLLGQVEQSFSEPSDLGLSKLITTFFNSWQDLSVTPNSIPLRQSVIQAAQNLSAKNKSVNDYLVNIKTDIRAKFSDSVDSLNQSLKQIQSLNSQIFEYSTKGVVANELIDKRDVLIDKLSQLANINVTYDSANSASISIGGIHAVDRYVFNQFEVAATQSDLSIKSIGGQGIAQLNGGELFAYSDVYSNKIPNYVEVLNNVMSTIVDSVNQIHKAGYTITIPPQTGISFFSGYEDGELKINQDILRDPSKIAISSNGTAGNGELALKLAELSSKQILNGNSLLDNYTSMISKMGTEKAGADFLSQSNQLVLNKLDEQKASYSGVSIDEEMTNIIKFQRSYDASARLIKIADEMLQTIINLV